MKVDVFFEGNWGAVLKQMAWMDKDFPRVMRKALRKEARHLRDEMKKELESGGNPKFAPISKMTQIIRKARGINSNKVGVASGTVLKNIKFRKKGDFEYEVGVFPGTKGPRGQDVSKSAAMLEHGHSGYTVELDTATGTGKTPRQWLWWLFFSGAIDNPPANSTTHMRVRPSPPRPFMANTMKREAPQMPNRLMERFKKEFAKVSVPSGGRRDASLPLPWNF